MNVATEDTCLAALRTLHKDTPLENIERTFRQCSQHPGQQVAQVWDTTLISVARQRQLLDAYEPQETALQQLQRRLVNPGRTWSLIRQVFLEPYGATVAALLDRLMHVRWQQSQTCVAILFPFCWRHNRTQDTLEKTLVDDLVLYWDASTRLCFPVLYNPPSDMDTLRAKFGSTLKAWYTYQPTHPYSVSSFPPTK